jgi:PDDEXK-like domain of unknown function (DUF3799)
MVAAAVTAGPRSALDLPHGLHEGVPEAIYHAKVLGLASKHALDLVEPAPAKYRAWIDADEDIPTPAMQFGKDFHAAALEPHLYRPSETTKAARDNAEKIAGMVAALRAHPIAGALLARGRPEVTARWRDPATGIECKARADLWIPELATIADLKSCADASPEEFARSVANYGYHAQEAMYRDGFGIASGAPVRSFVFIACEKAPPFLVAVYMLDEPAVLRGGRAIGAALERLRECLETDTWPGLPASIQTIDLPRWAKD